MEKFAEGGMILIDKPYRWTSFDVIKKLRYLTKIKKIGHAGTLDPLATGLLIVCFGKYTKKIEQIQSLPKVYKGVLELGASTPSYDLETEVDQRLPYDGISLENLHAATKQFMGDIDQFPPVFSAVKVKGKRAYNYAREGKEVELKSRKINISSFDLIDINLPEIVFELKCSKGTYVRSLVHDYGKELKSLAYLKALKRTAIGPYLVDNAIDPLRLKSKEEFYLHCIS